MNRFSENKWFFWFVMVLLTLTILYLLMLIQPMVAGVFGFFKTILAPFLIAMMISYVLNPVVNTLNKRKVPRPIAVLLIYALFFTSLTVILMNVIPMLALQLKEMAEHMPQLTAKVQDMARNYDDHKHALPESIQTGIETALSNIQNSVSAGISSFFSGLGTTINTLFMIFIVPFLAFYILKDFKLIEKTVITFVPGSQRKETIRLLKNIDEALGNYIRGQFLVCLAVGLLAYIGYLLIHMPYALLLASIVALFNIIPYLGPFIGAAPALIIASTISFKMVIAVLIVNFIVQILEGNVISPQIVGRTLHLHPLTIILVLLIGGQAAGLAGLILAVPLFAVLKVVVQHLVLHYVKR